MTYPFTAFVRGMARIWRHKRLLVWLYAANALFAAVLVYPFRRIVAEVAATDAAEDFAHGFQLDTFVHVWVQHGAVLKSLGVSALALAVPWVLVSIFMTGGVVAALAVEEPYSARRFFYASCRYFGRYFRLFLLFAVAVALIVTGYALSLRGPLETLQEEATTGRTAFLWRFLGIAIVLVLVLFAAMVFDYAKIRTVLDKRRSMVLAAGASLAFAFRRLLRCSVLFYLNLITLLGLFLFYAVIAQPFTAATLPSAIVLFVVQQLFVLGRIWMRLSFLSSQMVLYESTSQALPIKVSPEPLGTRPFPAVPPLTAPVEGEERLTAGVE